MQLTNHRGTLDDSTKARLDRFANVSQKINKQTTTKRMQYI